jgi:uncharacterized protein (TIGR01777 family)
MKVVVTGATGFIGRALCPALLAAGHSITALSRDETRARQLLGPRVACLSWGGSHTAWKSAVAEADALIHLAGESVAGKRWTPEFKAKLRDSRVEPTRALVAAMRPAESSPQTLLSASAVGYYGDRGEETLTEASRPGDDFLAQTCVAWEAEALRAEEKGARVVLLRTGIALGEGGALEKLIHPLPIPISPWNLGLGGPLGSGRQWFPWIHLDDVVGLYLWALTEPEVRGALNTTAPNPVTMAALARAIGRVLRRPALVPVPAFALRLLLGEFAESLLASQRVVPAVAERLGYAFRYTAVETALRALLAK